MASGIADPIDATHEFRNAYEFRPMTNARVVRTYEKGGFQRVRIVETPDAMEIA